MADRTPLLYDRLADGFHLLTPPADQAPASAALSRWINPDLEHIEADMRKLRLHIMKKGPAGDHAGCGGPPEHPIQPGPPSEEASVEMGTTPPMRRTTAIRAPTCRAPFLTRSRP